MFYGRQTELNALEALYSQKTSSLVTVYGRRRVGKSTLIRHFVNKRSHLIFEGIENVSELKQIQSLMQMFKQQTQNSDLDFIKLETWEDFFRFLSGYVQKHSKDKMVLVFDEFQWMCQGRSDVVSLFKYYWDAHFKNLNLVFILCGSIASFMVNKVIRSKALYGRLSLALQVKKLKPEDAAKFISRTRSSAEIIKYLMILGGVPKYWELIKQNKSFEQNIEEMFFSQHPLFEQEFEKIFYSHFKEPQNYLKIVKFLISGPKNLDEIAQHLKMKSSGGISRYLRNLELAEFVRAEIPFDKPLESKTRKYRLCDEFLVFYAKYVLPNEKSIKEGQGPTVFRNKVQSKWAPWMGIAFERFCVNHSLWLAEKMGFLDKVESYGPYWNRKDTQFQVDLIFRRSDNVITLCEMKFSDKPIGVEVIKEVQRKCELITIPKNHTLEKALITVNGIDRSVKTLEYFDHVLDIEDFRLDR